MSQKCPHCGLFNPPSALRCDCGYDFATRTLERSHLASHVLETRGAKNIARESSRRKIASGGALLTLAGIFSMASSLSGGGVRIPLVLVVAGALLLVSGLRERRQRAPDAATLRDVMRRS